MCLMAFAVGMRPDLPLLLAANRDEALDRPTAPWQDWHTPAGTLVHGGRDGRDGGTWIACSGTRIAMLTNVREPPHLSTPTPAPRSRGELALLWLDTSHSHPDAPEAALHHMLHATPLPDPTAYGGFNLVLGDVARGFWVWLNNRPAHIASVLPASVRTLLSSRSPGLCCAMLPAGVYGLSNAGLDTPWPKTQRLTQCVRSALTQGTEGTETTAMSSTAGSASLPSLPSRLWPQLWPTLSDPTLAADADLPHTGVPLSWERALSAIWVDVPAAAHPPLGYGTRSSLVLAVQHTSQGHWVQVEEQTWRPVAHAPVREAWWMSHHSPP